MKVHVVQLNDDMTRVTASDGFPYDPEVIEIDNGNMVNDLKPHIITRFFPSNTQKPARMIRIFLFQSSFSSNQKPQPLVKPTEELQEGGEYGFKDLDPGKTGVAHRCSDDDDDSDEQEQQAKKKLKVVRDQLLDNNKSIPYWNRYQRQSSESECGVKLFERDIYPKLAKKIKESSHLRMVINGTPGIGKTWFVDYLARVLLQDGIVVILESDRNFAGTDESIEGQRHLEFLIPPSKNDNDDTPGEVISFIDKRDLLHNKDIKSKISKIKKVIGDRKCWHIIDYRNKKLKNVISRDFSRGLEKQLIFASPDMERWNNFFQTDAEKGQEPVLIMPTWMFKELEILLAMTQTFHTISSDQLEILVNLFGPSPRYCFAQFWSKITGITAEESHDEQVALARAESSVDKRVKIKSLSQEVCSSSEFLEDALKGLGDNNPQLLQLVEKAATIIRGRIILPGVVKELEDICDSPTYSTCKSNVSTRLLTWGVQRDAFSPNVRDNRPYASYASPYIAKLVLEHSSKQALRSIARFFENGDRNIGAGSGWMYENFILKYWFPSLVEKDYEVKLRVIGEVGVTEDFAFPKGFTCETFGSLDGLHIQEKILYLPTYRNLGAVDCFMVCGPTLYLFQITVAASHSIVKNKLDEVIALAERGRSKLEHKKLIFVIPNWREKCYSEKAQKLTDEKSKTVRLTEPLRPDTKATLLEAANAIIKIGTSDTAVHGDIGLVKTLLEANKGVSTAEARQKLKQMFAKMLRGDGFQDKSLESWSVPRLWATYESKEFLDDGVRQLFLTVNKDDMPGETEQR